MAGVTTLVKIIAPRTPLPAVTQPVTIDGDFHAGSDGSHGSGAMDATLRIRLTGGKLTAAAPGLLVAAKSLVRGLEIDRFRGDGIRVTGAGTAIRGNYIGTDPAGEQAGGNAGSGVSVAADGVTVGGPNIPDRNLISGNGQDGVRVAGPGGGHAIVQFNLIGTDAAATAALPNHRHGVELVDSPTVSVRRNVLGGNDLDGIRVSG